MSNFQTQLSPVERYRLLQEELSHNNLTPNVLLKKADFYQLLDSRVPSGTFDREIADQLYDRMKKDANGRVLVDEFLKVYIEAQDFLNQNIVQTQQAIQEYESEKLAAVQNLSELRREEAINAYGIMEGSILTVQVLELKQLDRARGRDVFVIIRCGDHTFQTESLHYADGLTFDEQFKIETMTGNEMVQMAILAYGASEEPEVLGEIIFPVRDLSDQFFRDQFFDLDNPRGGHTGGQIHLKLQWIHSRVKYLETVIQMWDEKIRSHLEDKEDFEQSLHALNELFPRAPVGVSGAGIGGGGGHSFHSGMGSEQRFSPTQSQQKTSRYQESASKDQIFQEDYQMRLSQQEPQSQARSFGTGSSQRPLGMVSFGNKPGASQRVNVGLGQEDIPITTSQTFQMGQPKVQKQPSLQQERSIPEQSKSPIDTNRGSPGRSSAGGPTQGTTYPQKGVAPSNQIIEDLIIDWKDNTQFGQYAFWGSLILLILTLFSCFMKASFIELIICFAFLQNFDLTKRFRGTPENVLLVIAVIIIALLWDLIWLVIYTGGWGDKTLGWEPKGGVLIFVLIVEYLSLFIKGALLYCLWNFFQLTKMRSQRTIVVAGYVI